MKKLIIAGIVLIVLLGVLLIYQQRQSEQIAETTPSLTALTGSKEKIKLISTGDTVDLKEYLVKDYVVIFDFYADWCGPCKVLGPRLEELANKYDDVLLRKIDIVNWSSAVTKQHSIQFVPNVRVYDKQGRMIGEPTPSYSNIMQYVEKARK